MDAPGLALSHRRQVIWGLAACLAKSSISVSQRCRNISCVKWSEALAAGVSYVTKHEQGVRNTLTQNFLPVPGFVSWL